MNLMFYGVQSELVWNLCIKSSAIWRKFSPKGSSGVLELPLHHLQCVNSFRAWIRFWWITYQLFMFFSFFFFFLNLHLIQARARYKVKPVRQKNPVFAKRCFLWLTKAFFEKKKKEFNSRKVLEEEYDRQKISEAFNYQISATCIFIKSRNAQNCCCARQFAHQSAKVHTSFQWLSETAKSRWA